MANLTQEQLMGRVSPAVMAHLPCLSPPPQPVPQHQLPEHELPVAGRLLSAMGVGREPLSRASRSPEGGRALRLFGQQRGELSGSLACCCAPRKQVGREGHGWPHIGEQEGHGEPGERCAGGTGLLCLLCGWGFSPGWGLASVV